MKQKCLNLSCTVIIMDGWKFWKGYFESQNCHIRKLLNHIIAVCIWVDAPMKRKYAFRGDIVIVRVHNLEHKDVGLEVGNWCHDCVFCCYVCFILVDNVQTEKVTTISDIICYCVVEWMDGEWFFEIWTLDDHVSKCCKQNMEGRECNPQNLYNFDPFQKIDYLKDWKQILISMGLTVVFRPDMVEIGHIQW